MPGYPACCLRYPKKMLYWDHEDYSLGGRVNIFANAATALGYDVDTSADVDDGVDYVEGTINDYRVICWTQAYNEDEAVPSWYTDIKTNGWRGLLFIASAGASDYAYTTAGGDPDDPLDTGWAANIRSDWYLNHCILDDFRLVRQDTDAPDGYATADMSNYFRHTVAGEPYTDGSSDDWWVIDHAYLFQLSNVIDSANRTGETTDYYVSGYEYGCGHVALSASYTGGLTSSASGSWIAPLAFLVDCTTTSHASLARTSQKWMWHTYMYNSGFKCNAVIARALLDTSAGVGIDNLEVFTTNMMRLAGSYFFTNKEWHVALENGTDSDDDKWVDS